MAPRLMFLYDNPPSAEGWEEISSQGSDCEWVALDSIRFESLERSDVDVIVITAIGQASRTIALLRWLATHTPAAATLAILPANPKVGLLEALSGSVDDFVLWPIRLPEWRQRIARLLAAPGAGAGDERTRLMEEFGLSQLIGTAPAFAQTISRIPLAARSNMPVLITGETGTGKELCARAVHHLGPRGRHPFIPVDCGGLPEQLFENEVFGHAKGAFTDARTDRRGLVAMADGGTLFLDEVDALSLAAQSKLLRFLQERTFKPLGSDRLQRADVNVLAATNRDLESLVREKRFRSDLYFRLNVLSLHLVPLRARRPDIRLLAGHFVETISRERGGARRTISPPALRKLAAHDWPGNVRELYNVVQRALVFSEREVIRASDISLKGGFDDRLPEESAIGSFRQRRAQAIEAFERDLVEELLSRHAGNVTHAAREAQKDRRAFGRLVKKYHLRSQAS